MAITIKKKSNLDEIPIIDIEPLINNANSSILKKTGQKIRDACKNFGFFYIKNHNIPESHIDTLIPIIQNFFNLPLEDKIKIHINNSKIFRGYTPVGEEFTDNNYDWHECIDFGLEIQKNLSEQMEAASEKEVQRQRPQGEAEGPGKGVLLVR